MTLIRSLMAALALVASTFASIQASDACVGGPEGARCPPFRGPEFDMSTKYGRSSAQRLPFEPEVINVVVTGQSAKLVYDDLMKAQVMGGSMGEGVIQLVGPNAVCYQITKKRASGKTTVNYSCEIRLQGGAALVGAAG